MNGSRTMNLEHAKLEDLVSEYGKAQQEFGKAGGYVADNAVCPGHVMLVPADETTHRAACERYGDVMDALERHFCKPRWRRIWDALFGI